MDETMQKLNLHTDNSTQTRELPLGDTDLHLGTPLWPRIIPDGCKVRKTNWREVYFTVGGVDGAEYSCR